MRTQLALVVTAALAGGCSKNGSVDACAKLGARTCISLEVRGSVDVDQIEVQAPATPGLVPNDDARSPTPAGARFSLPVAVAILPDASFAGGDFAMTVRGLVAGQPVGNADVAGSVAAGQHTRVVATLTSPGGGGDGGDDAAADGGDDGGSGNVAAPRPLAPLSTATATTTTPTLHWELPGGVDGAHVELCRDRACTEPIVAFDTIGPSGAPALPLAPGVVFWRLHGRAAGVTGSATSATWEFVVPKRSSPKDTAFGTMLDVNGDGFADLAVPAPKAPATAMAPIAAGSGEAYVYLGASTWKTGTVPAVAATLDDPMQPSSGFATVVRSAGDVNGDGFGDVLVVKVPDSASGQTGAAFVFLGGPSGLGAHPMPASTFADPTGASDFHFGYNGVACGDLDGDGYGDVAITAFSDQFATMGVVYVYRGGPNGLGASPQPAWTLLQPTGLVQLGATLAGGADLDGDGNPDLVVGAPLTQASGNTVGAVVVWKGGAASFNAMTLHPAPTQTIMGSVAGASFGVPLAVAGDVNGDGLSDVAVGLSQPGNSASPNSVYVYFGDPAGLGASPATLLYPNTIQLRQGDFFGASFSDGADLDGDGFSDLAVGAPEYSQNKTTDNMPGPGIAVFYSGSTIGGGATITGKSYFFATGGANGDWFGYGLRSGDFDGDGLFDLFVGAPDAMSNAGKGYVVFGVSGGYGGSAAAQLVIPAPAGGGFGAP